VCANGQIAPSESDAAHNSAVILTDGQAIKGHVDRSSSRFYNMTLSDLRRDLTISCTCTRRSGDPDMCVMAAYKQVFSARIKWAIQLIILSTVLYVFKFHK
jgi:hypothetical protein